MDSRSLDEIEDLSTSSPPMQINGFVHNLDLNDQTHHINRSSSQIDIPDDPSRSLPIFLKFEDIEFKVKMSKATPGNPVKAVMSKVAAKASSEEDHYKQILKCITGSIGPGEILALMGPSGSGKTTLIGFVTQDDVLYPQLTAGRTIITTIHQPSSKVFHMFDKILLISEGHPMYYGKARDSMSYFTSLRFIPDIAMNPADFLLDLATGQVNDITAPNDIVTPKGTCEYERAVIKVQDRTRKQRKRSKLSNGKGPKTSSISNSSEKRLDNKLVGSVLNIVQENFQRKVERLFGYAKNNSVSWSCSLVRPCMVEIKLRYRGSP
ncbi:hypothetical protein L1987_40249 [Smallanthus sonchifolius]|uniref:Uncharacterized protein n=1 Tax=Smallanthus sonchifolius TaxID=185202 RepID=A0ACB9GTY1_9ASTR|nr:hypothetical protein L1987_40249 [Smallanthus sonchifolius]